MPAFAYQALTKTGKKQTGVVEADTQRQVRQQLREQGLIPMHVEPATQKAEQKKKRKNWFQPRIKTADLALLTRQLATLIAAALPVEQALLAVAEQTEKNHLQKILMAVRSKVVEGYSLADGMREFPRVFADLYCAMVAAGEKSGHLDEVLERLADYTEQRQAMKSQILQASVYPIILTLVAFGVVGFLLAVVVPEIVDQFQDMGAEIPAITQVLIQLSDFAQAYGLYIILALATATVIFIRCLQFPAFQYRVHSMLLQAPVIGKLVRGVSTARFARTLSILTASAIPLLEGLLITAQVMGNVRMKEVVELAADDLREGSSLRAALNKSRMFPPMMLHMIASGEKSGELEQMLSRCADNQDNEFSNTVNVSLKIFEPLLIVSMAAIVLFIVLAIITPIMNLNQQIGL